MNDINKIIQDLYGAYVKKDTALMKSLLDEGKSIDANNSYLKKYEWLYEKISSQNPASEQTTSETKTQSVVQFWGKTIKCPHCGSNLNLSEKNKEVLELTKQLYNNKIEQFKTFSNNDIVNIQREIDYVNNVEIRNLIAQISILKEQEIFKMIVAVASESTLFYDVTDEYEKFINNKIDSSYVQRLYRIIHTFKGSFSQLYMEDVVKSLHNFESILSELIKENSINKEKLEEIIENHDFKTAYFETKKIIAEVLGEEFLQLHNYIKIDVSNILDLQCKISNMIGDKELASPQCQAILCKIQDLSKQSLYGLLKPYVSLVKNLSQKFHKNIDELIIDGDKEILVKDEIKPFIKSLVHVFRNSVDHGIENPEDRVEKGKDESGIIICQFKEKNNKLHILVSDDGKGLDSSKIGEVAIKKGIEITSLSEDEIYKIIFNDNFSTKTTVSDVSGRGMGMSAVKNELEKLNGIIHITSQKDIGTTFEFIIPV